MDQKSHYRILMDRKYYIIAAAALCGIAAYLMAFRMPVTYESGMVMKVGKVAYSYPAKDDYSTRIMDQMLTTVDALQDTIKSEPFLAEVNQRAKLGMSPNQLAGVVKVKANTDTKDREVSRQLIITARAGSPQKAVEILTAIADTIVERHKAVFDQAMQPHFQYEAELIKEDKRLADELAETRLTLKKLRERPGMDTAGVVLLISGIQEKEQRLTDIKREISQEAGVSRTTLQSENTKVEYPPYLPMVPKGINKNMVGLIGLLAGAVVAGLYFIVRETDFKG